ncbi:MAG: Monoacylglycerol lipase [Bacteroidia bacterium]|nr:Monoacylglycerol lipase [Bacteroidia bacterium]
MKHQELKWAASDGVDIYGQCWLTDNKPKAVVCLVHGMGEHSGRYAHVANYFVDAGYAVISYDHRGHGKSGGKRGHTPSYDLLLDGVSDLLKQAEKIAPGSKKFIYGHSMGGNVVLNYALRRKPEIAGVIASSPWLKLAFDPPKFEVALGRFVNNIFPGFTQSTKLDATTISRDKKEVEKYVNDPLVHDKISARFFVETYSAAAYALEHASEFKLPLLIFHGTEDRLTSPEGSQQFADKVKGNCTFRLWDGYYHETHNEPEKEEVLKYITTWLDSQAG